MPRKAVVCVNLYLHDGSGDAVSLAGILRLDKKLCVSAWRVYRNVSRPSLERLARACCTVSGYMYPHGVGWTWIRRTEE